MSLSELHQELKAVTHPSLIAIVIRENPTECIPMLKDQIADNEEVCRRIIGSKLVDAIKSLK